MRHLTVVRKNYEEAVLKLQGRVVYAWPDGTIEDGRDGKSGVEELVDEAQLASDILREVVSQLGLLLTAATGSDQLPADQVRVCVEDVLSELESGSTIRCFLYSAGEAFNNAEPLPHISARRTGRSKVVAT